MLFADPRWCGGHGIARFSTEVLRRLPDEVVRLNLGGSPTHPLDVFRWRRLGLTSRDVLYSPGFNAGLSYARQLVTVHDLIHLRDRDEASLSKSLYYDRVVKPAIRRAGVVLTVSRTSAADIRRWLRDDTPVAVVGNGCSSAFGVDRTAAPSEHLLYVGNFKPHKNARVLFEALRLRPDHRMVVVTGDPDDARRAAAHFGVDRRVDVRSRVTDDALARLYRTSLGLLMPSTNEGFGLPALEAMMCGRRVACWSGCASVVEIVDGTGVLVDDPASSEEWAWAIDQLTEFSNADLLMSREWSSRFDWDDVALRVFNEIVAADGRT